jgi:hypothetical protein
VSSATSAKYSGMEGRRSTRVEHPVTLIVLGKNGLGQPFQEKTASVSVNLHGCRYPSRFTTRAFSNWRGIGDSF